MTRRRIKGIAQFRRMLRELPEATRETIIGALEEGGTDLLNFQRALAPFRTGKLQRGMSAEVLAASMKLKVGVWRKPARRSLFYGHIINKGRRAQVVQVRRRRGGKVQQYAMAVSALPAKNFMLDGEEASYRLAPTLGKVWRDVLFDVANRTGVRDPV